MWVYLTPIMSFHPKSTFFRILLVLLRYKPAYTPWFLGLQVMSLTGPKLEKQAKHRFREIS